MVNPARVPVEPVSSSAPAPVVAPVVDHTPLVAAAFRAFQAAGGKAIVSVTPETGEITISPRLPSAQEDIGLSGDAAKLFGALAKARGGMAPALKSRKNDHLQTSYATLSDVWDAIQDSLATNGLCVIQNLHSREDLRAVLVQTIIGHESGAFMHTTFEIPVTKQDAQGFGSAGTYARRYALMATLGIAGEDDDGNGADDANRRNRTAGNVASIAGNRGARRDDQGLGQGKDVGQRNSSITGSADANANANANAAVAATAGDSVTDVELIKPETLKKVEECAKENLLAFYDWLLASKYKGPALSHLVSKLKARAGVLNVDLDAAIVAANSSPGAANCAQSPASNTQGG